MLTPLIRDRKSNRAASLAPLEAQTFAPECLVETRRRPGISPLFFVAFALSLISLAPPSMAAERSRVLFDAGWRFYREDANLPAGAVNIAQWQWKPAPEVSASNPPSLPADLDGGNWRQMTIGQDIFANTPGFAWCRATVNVPLAKTPMLAFGGVDDNATVYVNGKRLLYHEGWNDPFEVDASSALKPVGPTTIVVLVENTGGPGDIYRPVVAQVEDITNLAFAQANLDDSSWRKVHLPHDFIVEGTFDPSQSPDHGYLPRGIGWYRKSFDLPASDKGKTLWLEFDAVGRDSQVWLNGHLLGRHPSEYTGFHYDISRYARYGSSNIVAVRADAMHYEGWFYEGGGIYRHVWLTTLSPVHSAFEGTFVSATVAGDPASPASATITVKTTVDNDRAMPAACLVESKIVDPAGNAVASISSQVRIPSASSSDVTQKITVGSPELWSLEKPRLYRLQTTVRSTEKNADETRVLDNTETSFGIRTIHFDANHGFFLNGRHVEIKGTCNHQDFAGVGAAIPDSILEWRLEQLKAMGSNAYRTAHNPPAPELLDDCDRLGILVMDENREFGDQYAPKAPKGTTATDLAPLREMIERDRNHPSIILWSLCNEEFTLQATPEGAAIGAAMKAVVNQLDGTRPVTAAMTGPFGEGLSTICDVQGINYAPDNYDIFHGQFPDQPIIGSETSSEVGDRGIYETDVARCYMSAYDMNSVGWGQTAEFAWEQIVSRPFLAGGFVWTGFDYKGEPTPYQWPNINCRFGIMDMCGFPKDNYYFYQSVWSDKPVVHLLPHWTWPGREGQPIDVWVFSNADHVELFLNGVSLGVKSMPLTPHAAWVAGQAPDKLYGHAEWSVPYTAGTLSARGFDTSGKLWATDTVKTAGPPAALRLTTQRSSLTADEEDTAIVQASVVDAAGNVVPTASNRVTFTLISADGAPVSAQIAGVGNGDSDDHDPDKGTCRSAFNGLCMALVQAGDRGETVQLTASSAGLASADLKIAVQR